MEVLQKLYINIPLLDAIQVPTYAKYIKDILNKKKPLPSTKVIKLTEECSAAILNKLPEKKKDPRCLLGILSAHRKIRKRTDTNVAFTREYSRVSISTWNMKCIRESRPSKDRDKRRKINIFLVGIEEPSRVF